MSIQSSLNSSIKSIGSLQLGSDSQLPKAKPSIGSAGSLSRRQGEVAASRAAVKARREAIASRKAEGGK